MRSGQKLFIIIVGCGRLGSYLANRLSLNGNSVVVIDNNESAFNLLSAEYSGFKISGDATELAVLKQAKIDKADVVIAASREDNINLMVSQIAKKIYKVPRVIARVFDTKREEIYRVLGIETVCPTIVAGDVFMESIARLSSTIERGNSNG